MIKKITLSLLSFVVCTSLSAQSLQFSDTIHDFGQIEMSKGAVSCSFTAVNKSSKEVSIMSVTTSCGCTNVKWDHNPIAPGATTEIKATYSNDEGPYPFDKTLTVKMMGDQRPVVLHIRGISTKKIKPDKEIFTTVYGGKLGLTENQFKCVNVEQGNSRSDRTTVANLSGEAIKVSFTNVTPGLTLALTPNPIPPYEHAVLQYTVKSSPEKWGTNYYDAGFAINGTPASGTVRIKALTAENFSSLTKEERGKGSRPIFKESTFSFGHKKLGSTVQATFTCDNKGAKTLSIHKIESEYKDIKLGALADIAPGKSGSFSVTLDTKNLPKGEALVIVTLITNSPMRPIVNLFLAGWID